jgi:CDP-diacylglycerol--glycerol-3-phosphate 3-phosphatidyltransferase
LDPFSFDLAASFVLLGGLSLAVAAHVVSSSPSVRALVEARVEREAALPLVGRAPMRAVYRALVPVARGLAALGVSANAVTIASALVALPAAYAFATGHFGLAAAIAAVASLADGLDGLVARLTRTSSRFGQVLDTTVDRYVDALFLGAIAIFARGNLGLMGVALAALVGSFMVSYASSVERELGVDPGATPMRRGHRLAFLLAGAALAPVAGRLFEASLPGARLVPVFLAVGAIAIVGNASAVRRLLRAAGPL